MSNDYEEIGPVSQFLGELFTVRDGKVAVDGTRNLFRNWFLGSSSSLQLSIIRALARVSGERIMPHTILRPLVVTRFRENITEDDNRAFSFDFSTDEDLFILGVTANTVRPQIDGANPPSGIFQDTIQATDYVRATIDFGDSETPVQTPTSLTSLTGVGGEPYLWPVVPFVPARARYAWNITVDDDLRALRRLEVSMQCMRFPWF